MKTRMDDLLMALLILFMAIATIIDRFVAETTVSQFVIGLLTGLTIVGAIVYIIRMASQTKQETG